MTSNISHKRDVERWYPLIQHPVQLALVTDKVRFKVVPAGRRSGKTERAKRYVVREAMRVPGPYFIAAPTRDQVKKIYWADIKALSLTSIIGRECVSESELTIKFPNGSTITLIGLDQPQRMEGIFWKGGVIDEIADVKDKAWEENISPALDTYDPNNPTYRAWCWLIGVPDGLNHYYEMAEYARTSGDPDWKLYTWKSSEILPQDVIEGAKRRMSARAFRQEYEASFETVTGRIYGDYGVHNHTKEVIKPHEQLHWFHDFNYSPMSSGIGVRRDSRRLPNRNGVVHPTADDFYVLDEIILQSAVARQTAVEFVDKFKDHKNRKVILFGDPAGRAGEKHGHASDYTDIVDVLKSAGWIVERKVKNAAPAIRDRQNAVRTKLLTASGESSLFVNTAKCPYMHKGFNTVTFKEGSSFLEEVSEYQHITTAVGYCIDYIWPAVKRDPTPNVTPEPTAHHWGGQK